MPLLINIKVSPRHLDLICCFPQAPHVLPHLREHAKALAQPARPSRSGTWFPFPTSSPSSPCSKPCESLRFLDGGASSILYFSPCACSCWKKLFEPLWTLSGLPKHPPGSERAQMKHSSLRPLWPFSAHTPCHQPILHCIKV